MGIRFKDYLSECRTAVFDPITEDKNDQSVEDIAAGIIAGEEAELEEGKNTKYSSTDGKRTATVSGRKNEHGEFITKFYKDGKHETEADSYEDDEESAHGNAKRHTKD